MSASSEPNTETNDQDGPEGIIKQWAAKHKVGDDDVDLIYRVASCITGLASAFDEKGIAHDISAQKIIGEGLGQIDAALAGVAAAVGVAADDATDYTKLRQVLIESKSASWKALIPCLEEWFKAHGIDFGKTQIHVFPPDDDTRERCAVFLSLPGDDRFDLFHGDTPDELFVEITKRCESRVATVLSSKDAAHMTVMNLPSNDLAYTNAVYINDAHLERGSLLFPETTTHVKVNGSRIFPLIKHPLVQKGCIAMSSLQRDSFSPQLPLAQLAKVSPCDIIAETKVATVVNFEFEPVANFKVDVDPLALIEFLRTEFKDCVVYPGTKLAHNKFANRVFTFRVTSGEGRIAESTQMYWRVNPKCKDIVNIVHNRLNDNDKDAAFQALLKEWDALQVQVVNVQHRINVLLKAHGEPQ